MDTTFAIILFLLLLYIAYRQVTKEPKLQRVAIRISFYNNQKNSQMSKLKLGAQLAVILGLFDVDTKENIEGEVFSNVEYRIEDESIATVGPDAEAEGESEVTGVAAGTTKLNAKADVKYFDKNLGEDVEKTGLTASVDVVVTPGPQNVGFHVSLGTEAQEEAKA